MTHESQFTEINIPEQGSTYTLEHEGHVAQIQILEADDSETQGLVMIDEHCFSFHVFGWGPERTKGMNNNLRGQLTVISTEDSAQPIFASTARRINNAAFPLDHDGVSFRAYSSYVFSNPEDSPYYKLQVLTGLSQNDLEMQRKDEDSQVCPKDIRAKTLAELTFRSLIAGVAQECAIEPEL